MPQLSRFSSPAPQQRTLNCRGRLLSLERPVLMAILNLTPDSFSDGGQFTSTDAALAQTERMLNEGATIIDIGGVSTRPGSQPLSVSDELSRIEAPVKAIIARFPEAIISIDTFQPEVAKKMLELDAHIINDVYAGRFLSENNLQMFELVKRHNAPLMLMHMQGTPETMQEAPQYEDVTTEVYQFFVERLRLTREVDVHDLVLDPGFGFGKTLEHNLTLMRDFGQFSELGYPLLAGISRKSMLTKLFATEDRSATLPGQTAMHLHLLQSGARILRVHDVAAAKQAIDVWEVLTSSVQNTASS